MPSETDEPRPNAETAPHSSHKQPPLRIEVVGVAASGKSTLIRALTSEGSNVELGWKFRSWKAVLATLRTALRQPLDWGRAFLLSPRLDDWSRRVLVSNAIQAELTTLRPSVSQQQATVLDQGPIFSAVFLRVHGQSMQNSGAAAIAHHADETWRRALDGIIYLETNDAVVSERLAARNQQHRMVGKGLDELSPFLSQYRREFEDEIARFQRDGSKVLTLDTHALSLDEIRSRSADFIESLRRGAL